jgi:hypothetical protein
MDDDCLDVHCRRRSRSHEHRASCANRQAGVKNRRLYGCVLLMRLSKQRQRQRTGVSAPHELLALNVNGRVYHPPSLPRNGITELARNSGSVLILCCSQHLSNRPPMVR